MITLLEGEIMKKFLFLFFILFLITNVFAQQDVCKVNSVCNTNSITTTTIHSLKGTGQTVYLFYSPDCPHCEKTFSFLKEMHLKYNINLIVYNAKIDLNLFKQAMSYFNQNDYTVPKLIVGNKLLAGDKEIFSGFEVTLNKMIKNKIKTIDFKNIKIKKPNLLSVVGLAFADSINPCALAVLLILLTVVLIKFNKKAVLKHSLAFIITIFISYLLIGILLVLGFKSLAIYLGIGAKVFSIIFGVIAIILGLLNFKDFISYGSGGFVMEVPKKWRPTMKKVIDSVTSVWSAVIIAFIVSFFLLPCTAGPYFLVSGLLYNLNWSIIISYLVVYNIVFLIPMVIISFLVYFGIIEIENIESRRKKYIIYLHLITAIVLILIGIYLLFLF